jgi:histidyl-tRNA synthetase
LGGGGRYDGLAKALGSEQEVPALGFAFPLERVASLLGAGEARTDATRSPRRVLVAPRSLSAFGAALRVAEALRLAGEAAEVALEDSPVEAHMRRAADRGSAALVVVDEGGESHRFWIESQK